MRATLSAIPTPNSLRLSRLWVDGKTIEITETGSFVLDGEIADLGLCPAVKTILWALALTAQQSELEARSGLRLSLARAGVNPDVLARAYPIVDPRPCRCPRWINLHRILAPSQEDAGPFHNDRVRGRFVVIGRTAPIRLLRRCSCYQAMDDESVPLTIRARTEIWAVAAGLASRMSRVYGLAYGVIPELPVRGRGRTVTHEWTFIGLAGFHTDARLTLLEGLLRFWHKARLSLPNLPRRSVT